MSLHQQQPRDKTCGNQRTNRSPRRRPIENGRRAFAVVAIAAAILTTAGCNGDETCDSHGRCSSTVGQQHVQVGNEPPRLDQSPW